MPPDHPGVPIRFEDRVKEKIDVAISDLLPPEELAELVKQQVAHFRREHLPKLVQEEIRAQLQAAIRKELEKPEYGATWDSYGNAGAGEAVKKLLVGAAPMILEGLIGGVVATLVNQLKYQLQQGNQRF